MKSKLKNQVHVSHLDEELNELIAHMTRIMVQPINILVTFERYKKSIKASR